MEIYYTLDGSKPSKKSIKYNNPIVVTENGTIQTIAFRGNISSEIKSAQIEKQTYFKPIKNTPNLGSLNRWVALKKFKIVEDVKLPKNPSWKKVTSVDLGEFKNQEHISMVFKGYFKAEVDGLYQFATKSDDGSLLYINNKLIVDNGGNHAAILRDGMVALKQGWHTMDIFFHQGGGGSELNVWYTSPNGKKQLLTKDVIGN